MEARGKLGGRTSELSGIYPSGRSGGSLVNEKVDELRACGVDVRTGTTVGEVTGFVGNFEVTLVPVGDKGDEETLQVGAIVLAIGADVYEPDGDFGYGDIPNVIGTPDFESVLGAKGKPQFGDRPVETVVFVQCVGSRGAKGNPECSRY